MERLMRNATGWTFEAALDFIRVLHRAIEPIGYGVALTGSVLTGGWREDRPFEDMVRSDLDLMIYPLSTANLAPETLRFVLGKIGMIQVASREKVREVWRAKGSRDEKHVEVWRYGPHRVDLFFVQ